MQKYRQLLSILKKPIHFFTVFFLATLLQAQAHGADCDSLLAGMELAKSQQVKIQRNVNEIKTAMAEFTSKFASVKSTYTRGQIDQKKFKRKKEDLELDYEGVIISRFIADPLLNTEDMTIAVYLLLREHIDQLLKDQRANADYFSTQLDESFTASKENLVVRQISNVYMNNYNLAPRGQLNAITRVEVSANEILKIIQDVDNRLGLLHVMIENIFENARSIYERKAATTNEQDRPGRINRTQQMKYRSFLKAIDLAHERYQASLD